MTKGFGWHDIIYDDFKALKEKITNLKYEEKMTKNTPIQTYSPRSDRSEKIAEALDDLEKSVICVLDMAKGTRDKLSPILTPPTEGEIGKPIEGEIRKTPDMSSFSPLIQRISAINDIVLSVQHLLDYTYSRLEI